MTYTNTRRNRVPPLGGLLEQDVAAMLRERMEGIETGQPYSELAHELIVVIRHRVLQEIATYARENIR